LSLIIALASISLWSWWSNYLSHTEQPGEFIGSLVALGCSLYLFYVMMATISLVLLDAMEWINEKANDGG